MYPFLAAAVGKAISWKETSSSSHVWDRMAYAGMLDPMKYSNFKVLALMSHMTTA
jgi:hypothetical protein